MNKSIIANSRGWFKECPKSAEFRKLDLIEITRKEELNFEYLMTVNPRYIFFPHWNWKVDSDIYENFECIAFHTAPLPYGRGGSPIQNLIIRGIEKSPVCALKMTNILDGGPIYDSLEVTLDGNVQEIFYKIAKSVEELILRILSSNPIPRPQKGSVVSFRRLTYADNELFEHYSIQELYDRIRMVDGEGYQRAYVKFGDYKLEFSDSKIIDKELIAKIRVYKNVD